MSDYLLAVDPATTEMGFCLFEQRQPMACFTLRNITWSDVVERTRCRVNWYIPSSVKPDMVIETPNDWSREGKNIRALRMVWSVVYGLAAAWIDDSTLVSVVSVSEWKGTRSKRSTSAEAALILKAEGVDATLAHNEHERDALALGLWWLRHAKERELLCST